MVEVTVLRETELIGIIAVLAGSPHMKIRNNSKYVEDIATYFENFKDHKAIKSYKVLEDEFKFNYDKPIELVLDYKDDKKCSETLGGYVGEEAISHYTRFFDELMDFKEKSNFENFYNQHIEEYSRAIEDFIKKTQTERCISFLKEITKEDFSKNYIINLMFAVTSANYGWQTKANCYCNIRPYKTTYVKGFPAFSENKIYVETLIVHEFAHSIINPITEKFKEKISKIDNKNFKDCFENNPYGEDKLTVINETIIRAIECLYVEKYFTKEDSQNLLKSYTKDGFNYIGEVANIIKDRSQNNIFSYFEFLIKVFSRNWDFLET